MKAISLFYSDLGIGGTSDKEYHVQIEKKGNGYVVLFQFGRRGGSLQTGDKTPIPVPLPEAESIFAKLVKEKISKGYQESKTAAKAPAMPDSNGRTKYPVELLTEVSRTAVDTLIRSPLYWLQPKIDGHRRQIAKLPDGSIVSYNKTGAVKPLPRAVEDALLQISDAKSFFLDGELVGEGFIAFDILNLNGVVLAPLPYRERYQTLFEMIDKPIRKANVACIPTWQTVREKQAGLRALYQSRAEGAVFKLIDAPYRAGDNGQHKRFKFIKSCTAKVIAVGRNGHNSATLALMDKEKNWRQVCGASLNGKDERITVGSLVEVKFLYATAGHHLYQPTIKTIRTDVRESECTIERQLKNCYKEGVTA